MMKTYLPHLWSRLTAHSLSREPLVHFLLAGLAVFLFSAWRGEPADPSSRAINVSSRQVSALAENYARTWQRPPSPAELDALIEDWVKEEVLYREALRLGLEADDTVIRRRLRAKMEFLARAEAEAAQPDDATLQAMIDRNPARYAEGSRTSFDQIWLGANDGEGQARAAAALSRVRGGADWRSAGQSISLPPSLEDAPVDAITRDFGEQFSAALARAEKGAWTGPVESGFGLHLVRVRGVTPGRLPPLDALRQRVTNDWRAETAKAREAKAYAVLRDAYAVTVDRP